MVLHVVLQNTKSMNNYGVLGITTSFLKFGGRGEEIDKKIDEKIYREIYSGLFFIVKKYVTYS